MSEISDVSPVALPVLPADVGLVDGSVPASTRRFYVVLADGAVAQLDELVTTTQILPDGTDLTHYGIVVEGAGQIEGAELPSDTARISRDHTMPGITTRRVEVEILRTVPELWLAPAPGAPVTKATGAHREAALFLDQMEQPLAVGLDQDAEPVYVDFSFLNGEKGGHVSISGISGVATKTTYALFLLYMLFETDAGLRLLGARAPQTRALVFAVKGEDLMHLDRANAKFPARAEAACQWRRLGVGSPGRFQNVHLYAPRAAGLRDGAVITDITSRPSTEVTTYGWPPLEFIRHGLLRYCFAEDDDASTQVSFIEQRVRVQLARWAWPLAGEAGAAVLCEPDTGTSFVFSRVVEKKRNPRPAGDGFPVRDFDDLVEFLTDRVGPDSPGFDHTWTAGVQPGTCSAFLRRLYAQSPRLGHLICCGVAADPGAPTGVDGRDGRPGRRRLPAA